MKINLAILILSVLTATLSHAEAISCKETVKKTYVDSHNRLHAYLEKRDSYVVICDVSQPYCNKWEKLLKKATNKKHAVIIKYYDLETSCLDIPSYAKAPKPFYIMKAKPSTPQDPVFDNDSRSTRSSRNH